jgi:hypothetical protein
LEFQINLSSESESLKCLQTSSSFTYQCIVTRFRHIKANVSETQAKIWEFDFDQGQPARVQKNYRWEAVSKDEVPQVYHLNHVKRLYSAAQNQGFEGQLPKLRYYHHIKKVNPQEEENNNKIISIKTQPITASAKKNGNAGQLKITGTMEKIKFIYNYQYLISYFYHYRQTSSKRRSD